MDEEEKKEAIELGKTALHAVPDLLEIFEVLPPALAEWTPFGWFLVPIEATYHTIKAMEVQERGAGYRGLAYGMMYGALGMGTPSHTVQESESGPDQQKLNQEAWNKGASEGAASMSDPVNRNHMIVRIAADGNDPHRTLNNIFQELCRGSDDHQLAQVYDSLSWPGPN